MISQANSFRQMATFPLRDETHGGEDVSVYAVGPQVLTPIQPQAF